MQLIHLRHETGAKFAFKLVINANENESHAKQKQNAKKKTEMRTNTKTDRASEKERDRVSESAETTYYAKRKQSTTQKITNVLGMKDASKSK